MGPIVSRLASDFEGRALVGRVDTPSQQPLVRAWGITATPTYVFFKDGREVSRQRGTTTYEDLAGKLTALLAQPSGLVAFSRPAPAPAPSPATTGLFRTP